MRVIDSKVLEHRSDVGYRADDSSSQRDALLRRAKLLGKTDRMVIELALRGGLTCRQIAELTDSQAGTVSRRVRRVANRLHDPLVVALTHDRCPLPSDYRQIGIEHFLQGLTTGELADLHQISTGEVRKMISYVRGWHRGLTTRRFDAL